MRVKSSFADSRLAMVSPLPPNPSTNSEIIHTRAKTNTMQIWRPLDLLYKDDEDCIQQLVRHVPLLLASQASGVSVALLVL